jgi:hypothetical protein
MSLGESLPLTLEVVQRISISIDVLIGFHDLYYIQIRISNKIGGDLH